MVYIAVLV